MKRGLGNKTAELMKIHPSTVSRNKERSDVVQNSKTAETLTNINRSSNSTNLNNPQ